MSKPSGALAPLANAPLPSDARHRVRGNPQPRTGAAVRAGRGAAETFTSRGLLMELTGEEFARRSSAGMSAAQVYELVRRELLTEFGADFFRSYIEPVRLVAEWNGILLFCA